MKKLAAICLAAPLLLATACDREANITSIPSVEVDVKGD